MPRSITIASVLLQLSVLMLSLLGGAPARAQEEPNTDHASPAPDGEALFRKHCLTCHRSSGKSEGPLLSSLQQMGGDQVVTSMTAGKMMTQAADLSTDEIFAVANYLTAGSGAAKKAMPPEAFCSAQGISTDISTKTVSVNGWGVDLENTRYQPDSTITQANVKDLEVAWVFALPDVADARSQAVVTEDTVFVGAISGGIYALDRDTGCIKWQHDTGTTLRTAASLGKAGDQTALFIGDMRANIYAVNAHTGEPMWSRYVGHSPASTTTGTPVPFTDDSGDRLFVPLSAFGVVLATNPEYECCKSHGAVLALDASSGEILWTTHMTKEAVPTYKSSKGVQQWGPSGAPVWTTPTIDVKRNLLYVGTGENTSSPATQSSDAIIAMDMTTGAIRWTFQGTQRDAWNMACGRRKGPNCPKEDGPDFDFGAAAILATHSSGKEIVVAGQKSGEVHAIDPDTGYKIWQNRVSPGSALGGVHWGITVAGDRVFVPIADPPFPRPGYVPNPGVFALDLLTGEMLWEHKAERGCELDMAALRKADNPWPECPFQFTFSAAPMSNADLVFAAALNGKVYAFAADSGEVLWQDHTVKAYEAVNGLDAHGGSIDNAGVQLAGDMLFLQSGYSLFGQMPGNALIAYRTKSSR